MHAEHQRPLPEKTYKYGKGQGRNRRGAAGLGLETYIHSMILRTEEKELRTCRSMWEVDMRVGHRQTPSSQMCGLRAEKQGHAGNKELA